MGKKEEAKHEHWRNAYKHRRKWSQRIGGKGKRKTEKGQAKHKEGTKEPNRRKRARARQGRGQKDRVRERSEGAEDSKRGREGETERTSIGGRE
jgi:hypothetical protein